MRAGPSDPLNVAISLREMKLRLAERDGYITLNRNGDTQAGGLPGVPVADAARRPSAVGPYRGKGHNLTLAGAGKNPCPPGVLSAIVGCPMRASCGGLGRPAVVPLPLGERGHREGRKVAAGPIIR
jgi:hypothetical protein